MQLLFILIAFIGLILTIYGARLWLKEFNLKELSEFDLIEQPKSIEFKNPGLYSINFIGIGHRYRLKAKKSFNLLIMQPNGDTSELINPNINYHFKRKNKMGIEVWKFKVLERGIHRIEFIGLSNFIEKNPFIESDELLIERKFETSKLKVLIKESLPNRSHFLMIVFLVLGINAFFWGVLLVIKPNIFE